MIFMINTIYAKVKYYMYVENYKCENIRSNKYI